MDLRKEFTAVWRRLGCERLLASFVYEIVERAYNEQHRRYHSLTHIEHCLRELAWLRAQGVTVADEVEMALWLHDLVYRVDGTPGSEDESGSFGSALLISGDCPTSCANAVKVLVQATAHGKEIASEPWLQPMIDQVLDIDLAILGAPVGSFDEYERGIRYEYREVPAEIFRTVRAGILKKMLGDGKTPLYRTPQFEAKYGAVARSNLAYSISRLEQGIIIE